jgi:hypothetical protein
MRGTRDIVTDVVENYANIFSEIQETMGHCQASTGQKSLSETLIIEMEGKRVDPGIGRQKPASSGWYRGHRIDSAGKGPMAGEKG